MSYRGERRRSMGDSSINYNLFADSGGRGTEGMPGRETEGEPGAHELIASDDDPRSYQRAHHRPRSVLTGDSGEPKKTAKTAKGASREVGAAQAAAKP